MGYLGRNMAQFGDSLADLGKTIYTVEAERQYKDEALAIAEEVDAFRKSLYTNPDHGVPGSENPDEAGYMGQWGEFTDKLEERIEGVKNPLAKQQIREYWSRTALEQKSQIHDIQFKAWAADTVSAASKRTLEMIQTGGVAGQDAFDYAQEEFAALRDQNLITEDELQTSMASMSQLIIRKGLTDEAKQIHAEQGLPAALRFIADNDMAYEAAGRTFAAGDDLKAIVEHDIRAYHGLEQEEMNATAQRALAYYTLGAEDQQAEKAHGVQPLTHKAIEDTKLDFEAKLAWHDRLSGYMRAIGGGEDDKALAYTIASMVESMAYAIQRGGTVDGKPFITLPDPVTRKPTNYPIDSIESVRKLMTDNYGVLAATPGLIGKLEKLLNETGQATFGAWAEGRQAIDAIKDPSTRGQASVLFETYRAQYPDANAAKVGELVERILSGKVYKEIVSSRFMKPVGFAQAEDKITVTNWDGGFRYDVAGADKDGLRPMAQQSRKALESFAAAIWKEAAATAGIDIVQGENAFGYWEQSSRGEGIYDYVVRVTGDDGKVTSFRAVPAIMANGKREASLLRQEYKRGADEVVSSLKDPTTHEWVTVSADSLRSDGWALPQRAAKEKAAAAPSPRVAKETEWPSATSAYPTPPASFKITPRYWKEYSVEERKNWYKDHGFTWDGSKFTKAGE